VTERQAYIGRVRALARSCCEAWVVAGAAWKAREEQSNG
jgi:glycyl-tRNA synthetase alpha chain